MRRRNWKRIVPRSPAEAMSGCAEHALARHNRGIERLATEHLGQNNASTLYKWMGNGKLPLTLILPFENAAGVPLITRFLAAAHGKLLIDIPTGRSVTASDIQELQSVLHNVVGALIEFDAGKKSAAATLDVTRAGLEALAWHHGNLSAHDAPQLDLIGGDDDD